MTYTATNVDVGSTEVQLHSGAADAIWIKAPSNKRFYVGPTGVTPDTGYPVDGEFHVGLALELGDTLFGITDGLTIPVRVLVQA